MYNKPRAPSHRDTAEGIHALPHQCRINPPKEERGHATPIEPVQRFLGVTCSIKDDKCMSTDFLVHVRPSIALS